eukprot:CAMPEP_0180573114 /NCGR_PEP_ID=MMETSP1037_2-20121125/9599_1 /TAXON_ID=632150 /ORGANISM="Azadinium spinosum, Strain 3D9" /LENGTH=65 /DNA_ID=CAMNT_0022590515 /DNA_START=256 /DNA_END=450 /DNA_ORIENTATION=-
MAWAFAAIKLESWPLLEALSAEALRTISEFEHQSLSNTLWAFATRAEKDIPLFEAISSQAIRRIT